MRFLLCFTQLLDFWLLYPSPVPSSCPIHWKFAQPLDMSELDPKFHKPVKAHVSYFLRNYNKKTASTVRLTHANSVKSSEAEWQLFYEEEQELKTEQYPYPGSRSNSQQLTTLPQNGDFLGCYEGIQLCLQLYLKAPPPFWS